MLCVIERKDAVKSPVYAVAVRVSTSLAEAAAILHSAGEAS